MRERLVEQFSALDDAGNIVGLHVYQEIIHAGSFGDPKATIPGMKRIETEDGDAVNYIDERTYRVVSTGLTLIRS